MRPARWGGGLGPWRRSGACRGNGIRAAPDAGGERGHRASGKPGSAAPEDRPPPQTAERAAAVPAAFPRHRRVAMAAQITSIPGSRTIRPIASATVTPALLPVVIGTGAPTTATERGAHIGFRGGSVLRAAGGSGIIGCPRTAGRRAQAFPARACDAESGGQDGRTCAAIAGNAERARKRGSPRAGGRSGPRRRNAAAPGAQPFSSGSRIARPITLPCSSMLSTSSASARGYLRVGIGLIAPLRASSISSANSVGEPV